jgi:hypothetical protein
MTEQHTHDHTGIMTCVPGCEICPEHQTEIKAEIETMEAFMQATEGDYQEMAKVFNGHASPTMQAILGYYRGQQQSLLMQNLMKGHDTLDAVENAADTVLILGILLGVQFAKADFDFINGLYVHEVMQQPGE